MRPLVIAVLGLLAVAPAASASTASVQTHVHTGKGCTADPNLCQSSELHYVAGVGEANDVQISSAGGDLLVRDPGVNIQPGQGCQRQGQNMVRCSVPPGPGLGFVNMRVELGDLADSFQNAANETSIVQANAGDDRLVGGALPDVLLGGAGRDRVEGAGGPDILQDFDPVEPDVLDGGDGPDMITYAGRRARVVVDLRSPANPSGEAGENDSLANFELARGGSGSDVMRGGNTPVEFFGHGGSDKLVGTFGADRLYGDSGHDRIHGFGGSDRLVGGAGNDGLNAGCGRAKLFGQRGRDRLYSANGEVDRADGGSHRDFARIDQLDVARRVERVERTHIDACPLDLRQRR